MAITYFGNTTATTNASWPANSILGNPFVAPATGNITTGRYRAQGETGTATKLRMAIYAQSGGNPGTLLGSSDEITVPISSPMALRTFTFSTPVAVVSGTTYYLVVHGGDHSWTGENRVAGSLRYRTTGVTYASGPPNPFGTASTLANTEFYIEAGIDDGAGAGTFIPRIIHS